MKTYRIEIVRSTSESTYIVVELPDDEDPNELDVEELVEYAEYWKDNGYHPEEIVAVKETTQMPSLRLTENGELIECNC